MRGFFNFMIKTRRSPLDINKNLFALQSRSFARKSGGGGGRKGDPSDNDFYGLLGVDNRNASQSDIKKAYF